MTSLDVGTTSVVEHALIDEPLLTLEALADAAERLPDADVEHQLSDLPRLLPGHEVTMLDARAGDVVRGVESNGCWVMLRSLATLPEYHELLQRAAMRFELAFRARHEQIVARNLMAFIGSPRATVPVHYDPNHHFLMQIRGSKTVGTGTFGDSEVNRHQIERGMRTDRLRADSHPDRYEERVLHAGLALVIPAWLFHWVHGGEEVSIAVTCVVATETTTRESAVHRLNASAS